MTDSLIEQAVFTSVCTENARGYQLASSSKGVSNDDKRFLATSGPSHDSLLNTSPGAYSVSYQELGPGCHCIGRTTVAGEEYSNRKGPRIYTQYLLVPSKVFARFSYSPFAFLRAATASGHICVHDNVPSELKSFRLIGRASSVDDRAVAKFVDTHGVRKLVAMVKQAIVQPSLMIISKDPTTAIEALLSCLSLELRRSVSFSTFLRFSPRRPFRLLGMLNDQAEQRRVQGYQRSVVFPVDEELNESVYLSDAWSDTLLSLLQENDQLSLRRFVEDPKCPLPEAQENLENLKPPQDSDSARLGSNGMMVTGYPDVYGDQKREFEIAKEPGDAEQILDLISECRACLKGSPPDVQGIDLRLERLAKICAPVSSMRVPSIKSR